MRPIRSRFIDEMARYASFYADARNEAAQHIGAPLLAFAIFFVSAYHSASLIAVWSAFAVLVGWYVLAVPLVGLATGLVYGAIGVLALALAARFSGETAIALAAATAAAGVALKLLGRALEGRLPTMAQRLRMVAVAPVFLVSAVLYRFGVARQLELAVLARRGEHFPMGDPRSAERTSATASGVKSA